MMECNTGFGCHWKGTCARVNSRDKWGRVIPPSEKIRALMKSIVAATVVRCMGTWNPTIHFKMVGNQLDDSKSVSEK